MGWNQCCLIHRLTVVTLDLQDPSESSAALRDGACFLTAMTVDENSPSARSWEVLVPLTWRGQDLPHIGVGEEEMLRKEQGTQEASLKGLLFLPEQASFPPLLHVRDEV